MAIDITGQVVMVTGASRGIGAATAIEFARAGCHLALVARDVDKLEQVAGQCQQLGVKTLVQVCDVRETEKLPALVEEAASHFGRLDILINNAGVGRGGDTIAQDPAEWDLMMDTNVKSVMHLTKLAVPHIRRQQRGAVIFISSGAGRNPIPGGAVYSATKHAIEGFSKSLWPEVREDGIKVSVVQPASTATDMTAGGDKDPAKMIQPEDIAETVVFCARFPDNACIHDVFVIPQVKPY